MKFRTKPLIEATRWYKNGDHPNDYTADREGFENGELRTFTGAYAKEHDWEGDVVRRLRRPGVDGASVCRLCGRAMDDHGWLDWGANGQDVCPGDWIITVRLGMYTCCRPHVFESLYEPVPDAVVEATITDGSRLEVSVRGGDSGDAARRLIAVLQSLGGR